MGVALKGWWLTAGLAVLIAVVDQVVDYQFLDVAITGVHSDLEFSVLAIGMFVLNTVQELVLCLWFLFWHYIFPDAFYRHPQGYAFQAELLRRGLLIACFVWGTHLRTREQVAQRRLCQLQRQTEHKLVQSLQASALAHELRQPLAHLLLQLQRLTFRIEQQRIPDSAVAQALDDLLHSGRQIDGLIDAISRLLRQAPVSSTRLNLGAIASASLQDLRAALQSAAVSADTADLDQPAWIQGDAGQLQLAIANLLRNALQVLQQSPQPRRLRLQIQTAQDTVVLHVADSGPGLPGLDCRELLLKSSSSSGMGLGLLTVQSIASNHGGRLMLARSLELGGAQVSLSLPAARPDSANSDTAPLAAPARRR